MRRWSLILMLIWPARFPFNSRRFPDAGKDHPCLIVDLLPEEILGRKTLRVTYLPISHAEPRKGESAILIKVANYLGLIAEKSYLFTSYACEDDWPFDVVPVPGSKGKWNNSVRSL